MSCFVKLCSKKRSKQSFGVPLQDVEIAALFLKLPEASNPPAHPVRMDEFP
jgi:hypothetical protein